MERYISDIKKYKAHEFFVVTSATDTIETEHSNTITLVPKYFDECPSIVELTSALSKRLHTQQLCSIAIGCICSQGYTLNHTSITGYQCKTFMSIWGHLETMRKSSSPELSQWLSTCLNQRSQEGYSLKFHCDTQARSSRVSFTRPLPRRAFNTKIIPIGTMFSEVHFGEATTVRDAMMADANTLSVIKLVFNEPILKNNVIGDCQEE